MKRPRGLCFKRIVWLFTLLSSFCEGAIQLLPDSRHHQTTSFALFARESSCAFLYRPKGKAWGFLGTSVAILEEDSWTTKPQLTASLAAISAFRFGETTLLVETIDARGELDADFFLTDTTRLTFGIGHYSGHTSESLPDSELASPNLGYDFLVLRLAHDVVPYFRFVFALKPLIGTDPPMKVLWAEQGIEWFPLGGRDQRDSPSPYMALGFEQFGYHSIEWHTHAQIGIYFGKHFSSAHHTTARLAVGYYDGLDPRLKYAGLKNSRVGFFYAGFLIDL